MSSSSWGESWQSASIVRFVTSFFCSIEHSVDTQEVPWAACGLGVEQKTEEIRGRKYSESIEAAARAHGFCDALINEFYF
jgi:hypothetical protein